MPSEIRYVFFFQKYILKMAVMLSSIVYSSYIIMQSMLGTRSLVLGYPTITHTAFNSPVQHLPFVPLLAGIAAGFLPSWDHYHSVLSQIRCLVAIYFSAIIGWNITQWLLIRQPDNSWIRTRAIGSRTQTPRHYTATATTPFCHDYNMNQTTMILIYM